MGGWEEQITESPTFSPTKLPTTNPTAIPTQIPTKLPTDDPTFGPTTIPTKYPTAVPTANPSQIPSEYPTEIPTVHPSVVPTESPLTLPPTGQCNMENAIFAEWSQSYLSIYIFVPDKHNKKKKKIDQIHMDEALKSNNCDTIFEAATLALLGSDAECFWMKSKNENALRGIDDDIVLVIDLASTSIINQNDSIIFLQASSGPLSFYCVPQKLYL